MQAARELIKRREVYGIIYIPKDFQKNLARMQQTKVSIFVDMSGILYYKAMLLANTNVSLAMNADIKVQRAGNTTDEQDKVTTYPDSLRTGRHLQSGEWLCCVPDSRGFNLNLAANTRVRRWRSCGNGAREK